MVRVRVGVLVTFMGSWAACTNEAADTTDCYWIGSINSLTGSLAPLGGGMENAAKLAVEDINLAGRVSGKKLCITTGDDRTKPDRAEAIVNAMIARNNVLAINGAIASSATLMAAMAAEANDMTIISGASSSPELSKDPLIYRTAPSDSLQGVALASVVHSRGVNAIAVIYIDNSYGQNLAAVFKGAFTDLGGNVTRQVPYKDAQASYVDVVQMALAEPLPEAVLLIAYPVDGAQLVRDWSTSKVAPNVRWFGGESLKDDSFPSLVGGGIPRFEGTVPAPNSPHLAAFVARYRAAYGDEIPSTFASYNYDAVILIALAIAKAGINPTPDAIRAAIPDISRPPGIEIDADNLDYALGSVMAGFDVDYDGVSGPVDLDANGDVGGGYRVWSIAAGGTSVEDTDTCFTCAQGAKGVDCQAGTCGATQ